MEDDDRRIRALEAKISQLRGEVITTQQASEIDWYDFDQLIRGMKNFRRARYCDIVERQTTAIGNLEKTHGIPVGGSVIDVCEVLKWFHGYLAKYGRKCNGKAESARDEEDEIAKRKQALDLQTLEIKFQMLQADFAKKAGNAISADEVDQLFAWFESELRKLGERLGKRFGSDAQGLFNDTLDRIGRHLEELLPKAEVKPVESRESE